ncbi:4'-phosphopantetheinyl transferase superfamily protein [Streptomyces sp. PKU-EA00015]|uniref:4'-phosphopantetheinyl transferase family protein n=1 Tax=Streptomyces sp. PKU-EA00015 TaxID=2748326 RepID=UPI0015A23F5C|nr:4'-phosphopantetheinyl transferase superfamily protein [Streptomyces sp. PKU-EA00015]NWF30218.1 4'-phosphopantetheinyl transferase superfamily protein [Streptomyces sp. PKU-EA00015]
MAGPLGTVPAADPAIRAAGRSAASAADVWYVGVDQVPESLAVLLDDHDRARGRRILREADRQRFLAAWVLARLVLGERTGVDPAALSFDRTCAHCGDRTHGKPVVETAGAGPDFSLSHVGGLAVVAVSDRAVGVDIEDAAVGEQPLASALTERERATCASYADFARLWTRKEALLKSVGKGLGIHPRRIEVLDSTPAELPEELGRSGDFALCDLPLPAPYVGALAVRGPRPDLTVHEGAELVGEAARLVSGGRSSVRG